MQSREGLERRLRNCLDPLEKEAEELENPYEPIFEARNLLNGIENRLPPKTGSRGGSGRYQNLRDWLRAQRIALEARESQVEDTLQQEIGPRSRAVRRTKLIAEALNRRDEPPPLFGFEGKTDFLEWAVKQIGQSESTVRNALEATGCFVKGKRGREDPELLRETLQNILDFVPVGR